MAAALAKITTTHLLALAVDLPLMTADHLRQLKSQAISGSGVMPVVCGRHEPMCAIYPAEANELARAALAGADVSLNAFIKKLRANGMMRDCAVPAGLAWNYRNTNTPGEFSGIAAGASVA